MRRILALSVLFAAAAAPPATKRVPVTDAYYDVKVVDDYRWLENSNDPAVIKWVDEQNRYSRAYLDAIPHRAEIEKRLRELSTNRPPSYGALVVRGARLFALKFQPPKQQQMLVTLASAEDLKSEKMVLDPNVLDAKGTTAIDWFVPSQDGKYVAISISKGGSEDGTLHIYETATAKPLPDAIAHVQYPTAGGSSAWNADGTGIYYTRFPRKGQRPEADLNFYQQVYFHKLGTADTEDSYCIGKDFPRIAEIKRHLDRYQELVGQGKWSEAGRELEAIRGLVGK